MKKRWDGFMLLKWIAILAIGQIFAGPLLAQNNPPDCGPGPKSYRIDFRLREPGGIGYKGGYATIEAFLAGEFWGNTWVPFLDLRGHLLNHTKVAANAGVGLRYLRDSRIWGFNAYYDLRNTTRRRYNQIGAGFEALGETWDFRLNGYVPFGRKVSSLYGNPRFYTFQGHHLVLSKNRDSAMSGLNAEAAIHVNNIKDVPFYFAAGPYYLRGKNVNAWGGQGRAILDMSDYVRLEGNVSYDNVFKWIGQGEFSINIPLGPKRHVSKAPASTSCDQDLILAKRLVQPVDRSEIIPVNTEKFQALAINPLTNQPYFFWFVNNTSHSEGTFESPYPSLVLAQNSSSPYDVIYVYPGDGTTTDMNTGIILQNQQWLFGAFIEHPLPTTVGLLTIPPMASGLPNITNTGGDVVAINPNSNGNIVSGFNIIPAAASANGISGTNISNLFVDQNTFSAPTTLTTNCISLTNPAGFLTITNSAFNDITCTDGSSNGNAILLTIQNDALNTFSINSCTFSNVSDPSGGNGGNGVFVNNTGSISSVECLNNTFTNFQTGTEGIHNLGTIGTLTVAGNKFIGVGGGANCIFNSGPITTLTLTGNTFSGLGDFSTYGLLTQGTIGTFFASNNTFTSLNNTVGIANMGTIGTLATSNNTFSNLTNNSDGYFNDGTIGTFFSSNNTFSSLNSTVGILNVGTIGTLATSNNTFSNLTNNSGGYFNDGSITAWTSNNDNFSGIEDTSVSLLSAHSAASSSYVISGNIFSGNPSIANVGYAVLISVTQGATCLEFTNNSATPTSGPDPYQFVQTGGAFNTATVSGNTGAITYSGTFGTCTNP